MPGRRPGRTMPAVVTVTVCGVPSVSPVSRTGATRLAGKVSVPSAANVVQRHEQGGVGGSGGGHGQLSPVDEPAISVASGQRGRGEERDLAGDAGQAATWPRAELAAAQQAAEPGHGR